MLTPIDFSLKTGLLSLLFVALSLCVSSQIILNEDLRSGSLPSGWTESDVNFATSAGGYALFTGLNSTLTTPTFDASSNTSVDVSLDVAKFGSGTDGPITVEYSLDGGTNWVTQGNSASPTSSSYLSSIISIPTTSATMQIRFNRENSNSQKRLRDVIIEGIGSAGSSDPEPTNHPTLFSCVSISSDEIQLNWTDAVGAQLPAGYLIKWSDVSFADISNPVNGSTANGANSITVNQGAETVSITGLTPNTDYFFKIWPYSNSNTDIDYKTSPIEPQSSCTTDNGPTCIATQSFEGGDSWGFSTNPAAYNVSGDVWNEENSPFLGLNATDGSNVWAMQDLNNSNGGGSFRHELIFSDQSVAGVTSATISFDYEVFEFDNGDDLFYEVFENGASLGEVQLVDGNGNLSQSGTVSIDLTPGISTASITISATQNGGGDYGIIDNVRFCGFISSCIPTHTLSSFQPLSGPPGTLVTVSGSGFTGATSASLSGIAATSINVIDDNTAIVEIPEGATSGTIGITVAACEAISGSDFTFIDDDGDCGTSGGAGSFASDLFISEVYDANSGSLSYIEVFNGTNAAIPDLSTDQYVIRVQTGSSNINDYPMSGSLASGDTYILRIGSGSICSGVTPDDDQPSAPGFNGDDNIYLRKNGAVLDDVPNPNVGSGFSQSRNADVTSPNATYDASEWTIGTDEVCDDLGTAPYIPNGASVTINTQPADVDCAAVTFSVNAMADPVIASTNPYVWRYNAPGADTWELVSALDGSNGLIVSGTGTSSITITGNTAELQDYQFYVDVTADGTPDCTQASNAAQFTYDTRAFYRSVSTGDWTDASSWEMSDTEGGTYVAACEYPLERNSDKVTIQNGNTISFDLTEITVDQLEIESGGTLSLGLMAELVVNDGNPSGADLVIAGILEDKAESPNGVNYSTGASWEMGANGTLVKTNTSSTSRYRDNYEGGISNIPSTAQWTYRREAANDVSIVTTNMFYPNLTFENNVAGTYAPTTAQQIFQGASGTAVIKGDLDIGGSGTSTYTVTTNNTNSSPILIEGDLIIQAGSTLTNDDVGGADEGTGIEVRGDLILEGSLILSTSTDVGRGQLVLSGSTDQIGIGDGNTILVNELELNKSGGEFFTEFSLDVNREARFIDGIYEMDDAATNTPELTFLLSSNVVSASNASFVDGTVVKFGDQDFVFPVGDVDADGNPFYQPLSIFDLPGIGGYSARYYAEQSPNAGEYYDGQSNNVGDFQEISNCDYWELNNIAGGNPRFSINYTNTNPDYCNVVPDPNTVTLVSWNGFSWDPIDSAPNGNTIESGVAIQTPITGGNYGQISFSSDNLANILPITLLSFNAQAKDNLVETNWITASEINNDYFNIERSKDGLNWESIGTVQGSGDSNQENSYSFVDDGPYLGISYYRLRQTDFDGKTTVSDPQAVEIRKGSSFGIDQVYRGQDGINIAYRSSSTNLQIEIFDLLGKRIHLEQTLEGGRNGFITIPIDLVRGAYILRISDGRQMDSQSFIY